MPITGMCNRCPVCRAALGAPSSDPLDQTCCPRCSAELWVLAFSEGPAFFPRRPGQTVSDMLAAVAGKPLDFSACEIENVLKSADSFDVVELLAEVEEVAELTRP